MLRVLPPERDLLGDRETPAANPLSVDHRDRMLQLKLRDRGENAIEEVEHVLVGVEATTEQDTG